MTLYALRLRESYHRMAPFKIAMTSNVRMMTFMVNLF